MDEPKQYLASYPTSMQVSNDEWQVYNRVKLFTGASTLDEIKEWMAMEHPNASLSWKDNFKVKLLIISEPD